MKLWLTLYEQVVRVFGDGYNSLMEENGTYGASGMFWGYSWRSVGLFSDGGGIGMVYDDGGVRLYVRIKKSLFNPYI